ncbi:MAG TPA: hypothetical protein VGD59_03955 [Acidisarcina sp.]
MSLLISFKNTLRLSLPLTSVLFLSCVHAQVNTASLDAAPGSGPSSGLSASAATVDPASAATPGPNTLNRPPVTPPDQPIMADDCGDALSEALRSDGSAMPCWSNIRTVDRWNTTQIPDAGGIKGATRFSLPREKPSAVSFVLGSVDGTDVDSNTSHRGYGGVMTFVGLLDHRRWQLQFEDAGSLADFRVAGDNNLAGLNRTAIRGVGELTPRLVWQASATNTYATDALRLFAPLDYRAVGNAEAPVADTVAYGLHAGRVTDEQEDFKFRYEASRRTNWDFAVGHTLQDYSDDGVMVQTVRGRIEFLRALTPNTAFGVYGNAERQDGPSPCSFSGAGLRSLSSWGTRVTLSISGGLSGADASCGSRIEGTGDVAFSVRAGQRSWIYVSADRSLSDGIVEQTAFLNSGIVGLRHTFRKLVDFNISGAGILGTAVATDKKLTGTFSTMSLSYPLGRYFIQETSVRHFQVNPTPGHDDKTLLTFTLWFNGKKKAGGA